MIYPTTPANRIPKTKTCFKCGNKMTKGVYCPKCRKKAREKRI